MKSKSVIIKKYSLPKDIPQGTKQYLYLPLTLQAPLDLLNHVEVAEYLAQQCEPVAEPSLVLRHHPPPHPLQNQKFLGHLVNGLE